MQQGNGYRVPTAKGAREALRAKGQFWTPDWLAEVMVDYVINRTDSTLFDPAVGAGAFFRAGKRVAEEQGISVAFSGMEIDPEALKQAGAEGVSSHDLSEVTIGDFVLSPPDRKFRAIVANPPYIRHHRIGADTKRRLKALAQDLIGRALDGRAGLHIYFLLRALTLLEEGGRLAFIMPADTCEGKSAPLLWKWISANFALDGVITFDPPASPFPAVDTNPLVFFIRRGAPRTSLPWIRCHRADGTALRQWLHSDGEVAGTGAFTILERPVAEAIATGLSRPPRAENECVYRLGDFVRIVRGVATGANEFFLLTGEQVAQLGIPKRYFVRAVGRTRDVPTDEITPSTLRDLEEKGRPTFLLALNGSEAEQELPPPLRRYLRQGEALRLPQRPLIAQRKPWYKTESRVPPAFLFTYLGRRTSRFIRNSAGVIPLTGFLCVYPHRDDSDSLRQLWQILNHPDVIANLALVGKSYGDGAIKVEPRALEKLPVPTELVEQTALPLQLKLFEPLPSYPH